MKMNFYNYIMAKPSPLPKPWEKLSLISESIKYLPVKARLDCLTDCVWQLALDRFRGQSSINCFWYKSPPCLSHAGFDLIRSSVNSYRRFLGKKLDEVLPRKNILYPFLVKNELQFLPVLIWYKSVLTIFMWCLWDGQQLFIWDNFKH